VRTVNSAPFNLSSCKLTQILKADYGLQFAVPKVWIYDYNTIRYQIPLSLRRFSEYRIISGKKVWNSVLYLS
jgi:hypothetical protein